MASDMPGVVKTDDKIGRYLEAIRNVGQGEQIIGEDALITGPSGDPSPYHICLGCYKVVTGSDPYLCSVCKWPMCDDRCEKILHHAKFECKVFKNAEVKVSNDPIDYLSIQIMRCLLLKEVNAKKYDLLMKLESHQKSRSKVAGKEICEFIHKRCNLKKFDTETIGKIEGIVIINSFATTDRLSPLDAPRMASLIFYNAAMMSHNCVPNTSWIRVENPDNTFGIRVWATVPINKGELITTQYLDITRPSIERRAHLQETYHFFCTCKRCSDPKELGTYFSAIKCSKCQKGYVISTDPLAGPDADWACESCKEVAPWRECAVPIETEICGAIQSVESEAEMEALFRKHAGVTVHENHYLMMDLRHEIVKRLYNSLLTIKDDAQRISKAKLMVELCKPLSKITEAFYPGTNKIKARIAYYLKYAELCSQGNLPTDDLDKIEDVIREGKEMSMFDK